MRWAHFNPKTKAIPEDPYVIFCPREIWKCDTFRKYLQVKSAADTHLATDLTCKHFGNTIRCPYPSCILWPSWCSDQIVLRQATLIRNPRVSSDRFLLWRENAKPFFRGKSRQETVATDAKTFLFLRLNVSKFHQMATRYDLQLTPHSPHKWGNEIYQSNFLL